MTGTVTRVFLTRGFGFVAGEDGESYFLHIDALQKVSCWEQMQQGRRVEFEPSQTGSKGNGLRATKVRCVESCDVTAP